MWFPLLGVSNTLIWQQVSVYASPPELVEQTYIDYHSRQLHLFCGPEGNRTLHDLLAREFRQPWYMQAQKYSSNL